MNDSILTLIEKIKPRISEFKQKNINEAQTKEWLIKPFFEALGWNFSDPDEVIPEDDDSTGKRPDYSFHICKKPKFLVEAKSITNPLDDNKMITEKINYCANSQIPFLIITNGIIYKIYYSELKGSGKDKLLQEFSIIGDYDEEIIDMLTKQSFEKDKLHIYSKNIFILTNIKKAIENIFQSPGKKVLDMVNEKLKEFLGHKFGNDEVEDALKQFSINISSDIYESEALSSNIETDEDSNADKVKWTTEHQFKLGKWQSSLNLYNNFISELKKNNLSFEENPTKFYISLLAGKTSFCQMHGQKSAIKIWINLEISDLSEQEKLKVRDVSNIGHWGLGNIECILTNEADFDWAINIVNKSYQKNVK